MAQVVMKTTPGHQVSKARSNTYDASLLHRCMDMLQIDRAKLVRDEPLLYRELQGICSLCPNKQDCSLDLAGGFDAVRWDEWWLYCPNSAMLTTVGASQKRGDLSNCAKLTSFSHLRIG